jgi:hypothetical protein
MDRRGWPTCPYVNPVKATPDDGIEDFLEVPRFSTGYAALHHTIGFMPETHMLKPFADRYAAMRALVESVLAFTVAHGPAIQALRQTAREQAMGQRQWPVRWKPDYSRPSIFRFKGYATVYRPSVLGDYQRLAYDRSQPWEKDIAWFNRCQVDVAVDAPRSYLIPQAWRETIERLQWNGVRLERIAVAQSVQAMAYQIESVVSRSGPYEGQLFHDEVTLIRKSVTVNARVGDVLVHLNQPNARYAVETLEPQAHDSFFHWGFFNSILEKKEAFSDYVFEDTALEMLESEPQLREAFERWKTQNPDRLGDQQAVLSFIFAQGQRYAEPEWRRYPVLRVL